MNTGTVKWFNAQLGYGFITPDDGSKDLFAHSANIENTGPPRLYDNQRVSFDTQHTDRGPYAVHIRPLAEAATSRTSVDHESRGWQCA